FTVTERTAFGQTVGSYRGTVQFSSSDPRAMLQRSYTFTASDAGSHTFAANLLTAGRQTITVTDSTGLTDTVSVVVTPAAPSRVVVSGYPSPTTAGDVHTFTVTAVDQFGNTTPGYTGTVHFTSSDGQAVLPADYTFVSGDAGVHTFSATLKTAGSQSITATD